MSDTPLRIKDFKVSDTVFSKIRKIGTPFSIQNWTAIFLIVTLILLNRYIISNFWINLIYIIMCLMILLY
jgi:hypothetical protein